MNLSNSKPKLKRTNQPPKQWAIIWENLIELYNENKEETVEGFILVNIIRFEVYVTKQLLIYNVS